MLGGKSAGNNCFSPFLDSAQIENVPSFFAESDDLPLQGLRILYNRFAF